MKLGMLIAMFVLVILFSVGITIDAKVYQKKLKKDAEETDILYQEATEWYNKLSIKTKADIMDVLWDICPTPNNGKKYMISIYLYFNKQDSDGHKGIDDR